MAKTIVGLYETFEDARKARAALVDSGYSRDNVSVVAANSDNRFDEFVDKNARHDADYSTQSSTHDDHTVGEAARDGAIAGGAIGGIGGVLLGLGLITIPGIGVVAAAGPVVSGLIGLVTGAVSGGLLAALVEAGISDEDAEVYAEGVRRGYVLLLAKADAGDASDIARIMNSHGAIDTDLRSDYWRSTGWEGYEDDNELFSAEEIHAERTGFQSYRNELTTSGSATVPVIKEEMRVGKREVEAEQPLRVRTYIHEEPVSEQVSLRKEHIDVDRHAVDRPATEADFSAFEEGTIEVTATNEEAVVDKQARVVEEVTISKDVETDVETVTGSVRETKVDIERGGTRLTGETTSDFDFDDDYRTHYDSTYNNTSYDFDYYRPAYSYGASLASTPRYRQQQWDTFEPEARQYWERDNDSAWDDVKDAVRHGWNRVRAAV